MFILLINVITLFLIECIFIYMILMKFQKSINNELLRTILIIKNYN